MNRSAPMWILGLLAGCAGAEDPRDSGDSGDSAVEDGRLRFGFPLPERARFFQTVGVDHDPEDHSDSPLGNAICVAFDGSPFPACYDGHDGTDFLLEDGWESMDAGSTPIVAAADGVVSAVHDGEYDRCHIADGDISCDGHPVVGNHVILTHADGTQSKYWHMMAGSVAVAVGETVACGTPLGRVGSSGYSSTPHLHFEVADADGLSFDPYAGERSQPETWWAEQESADGLPGPGCTTP